MILLIGEKTESIMINFFEKLTILLLFTRKNLSIKPLISSSIHLNFSIQASDFFLKFRLEN